MRFRGIPCWLSLGVFCVVLAVSLFAAEAPFETTLRSEQTLESGLVQFCELRSGKHSYAFVPPAGWRIKVDRPQRCVIFENTDFSARIEMRFTQSNPAQCSGGSDGVLKKQVLSRFPAGQIVEQFSCHTSVGSGQTFDLHWAPSAKVRSSARVAVVAADGEVVEICLIAARDRIKEHFPFLNSLLTSFRALTRESDTK